MDAGRLHRLRGTGHGCIVTDCLNTGRSGIMVYEFTANPFQSDCQVGQVSLAKVLPKHVCL